MISQLTIQVAGGTPEERVALAATVKRMLDQSGVEVEGRAFPCHLGLTQVRNASAFAPVNVQVMRDDDALEVDRIA
jgi:2'-5' RNA ligase